MTSRAWLSMAVTAALWGASYMFIKVCLDGGLSVGGVIFLRTALGAAVLAPLAVRADAVPALLARRRPVLALAATQVVVPFALITFGERHVPSALAGILVAAAPLFLALVAPRLDPEERSQGRSLVGVVLGLVGVVVLFGLDLSGSTGTLVGGAMIVGAALSYAFAPLIAKRYFAGVPAVGVAASTMVLSAVLWLPVALVSLPTRGPSANVVLSMLALGAAGTGIAFLLYYRAIADVGPARASVVAYVAPAFAVLYGVGLLGEKLTAGTVAGLALILAGSWLAAQRPGHDERPPADLSRSGPSRSSAPAPARAR